VCSMNIDALQSLKSDRFFESWEGFESRENIAAAESAVRELIERLIASGPNTNETTARSIIGETVQRFNEIDDWPDTATREDLGERIILIAQAAGFEVDEDWLAGRDW
jgi:hypothetical protein